MKITVLIFYGEKKYNKAFRGVYFLKIQYAKKLSVKSHLRSSFRPRISGIKGLLLWRDEQGTTAGENTTIKPPWCLSYLMKGKWAFM